jgi:cob(I)alamin adenosyltransferase
LEETVVEGQEVVMGYQNEGPLIEAPFHGIIELLTEDTAAVEVTRAPVRGSRRAELNVWRVVTDGEVEGHILNCLSILLLGKAVEADGRQVGSGKGYVWRIEQLYLRA